MKIKREIEEDLIVTWTDSNGVEHARDATPADQERAGWVPLAAFVGPLDLLSPPTLAGALEAIHSVREAVATACDREADELRERLVTAELELSAETIRADEWKAKCVEAESSLSAAESANAEGSELLAAETARAERAERERDEAKAECTGAMLSAHAQYRDTLGKLKAAREALGNARDDESNARDSFHAMLTEAKELARVLEVERDAALDARNACAAERNEARAEVERLTAPGEGSLDNGGLVAAITRGGSYRAEDFDVLDLQEAYRLGVAHERARQERPGIDEEAVSEVMRVGLAQCDALRRTVAKLTERCEQWEGERNAIAFVLSTPAERRKDAEIGSLGYATLARLLGEVSRG